MYISHYELDCLIKLDSKVIKSKFVTTINFFWKNLIVKVHHISNNTNFYIMQLSDVITPDIDKKSLEFFQALFGLF